MLCILLFIYLCSSRKAITFFILQILCRYSKVHSWSLRDPVSKPAALASLGIVATSSCFSGTVFYASWEYLIFLPTVTLLPVCSQACGLCLAEWAQQEQSCGSGSPRNLYTSFSATLDVESGDFVPGGANSNLSPIINFCKLQFISEKNDSLKMLMLAVCDSKSLSPYLKVDSTISGNNNLNIL